MLSLKLKFIFIHIPKTSGNELPEVFIHIPKTSGNSLSSYLKDVVDNQIITLTNGLGDNQGIKVLCEITKKSIKHFSIKYYNEIYKEKINEYYKFTIVRNPYDRMLSFYFWSKGINDQKYNRTEFIEFIKTNNDFPYSPQYTFISIDFHIIHYENLLNELKQIECFKNIYNFENYPHQNASINNKLNKNDIYDTELKNLVYNKFKKDFELFGYEY